MYPATHKPGCYESSRVKNHPPKKQRGGIARMKAELEIKQNSRGYILIRKHGEYSQHAHLKSLKACNDLIKLIELNKLPRGRYLKGSCKRLLTEEEYNQLRPGKQMYYNVNKGVR